MNENVKVVFVFDITNPYEKDAHF